jgi:hypothetical protein
MSQKEKGCPFRNSLLEIDFFAGLLKKLHFQLHPAVAGKELTLEFETNRSTQINERVTPLGKPPPFKESLAPNDNESVSF